MSESSPSAKFVVATPGRSVCDDNARVLEMIGRLRFLALATRRGTDGVPRERTHLNIGLGLANYIAAKSLSTFKGESFRYSRHPHFDRWVKKMLTPGDHIISSYGYVNECFEWVREHGGKTFLDGGNSHPANFWETLLEEHRLWNCPLPPIARFQHERALAMMEHVDYVLAPSNYVKNSFLKRGFKPEQMLQNIYPVNLINFYPQQEPRPKDRPFTIINTGSLSLRKGTPYLLEAFRIIRRSVPNARLLLTRVITDSLAPVMANYKDLPIEWAPALPHGELATRLREADVYILPSLEEGLARTGLEGLACGLPAIVTAHTGINEFIQEGKTGSIVPIRDAQAVADAALAWWEKIQSGQVELNHCLLDSRIFGFSYYARTFLEHVQKLTPGEMDTATRSRRLSGPDDPDIEVHSDHKFVVATPARSPHEVYARVFARNDLLAAHCLGSRKGSTGVPREVTRLNPVFGLLGAATGMFFSTYRGEALRFGLNPWYDRWASWQVKPGNVVLSSYGYANACFQKARSLGGLSILDAGNSHPEQFWTIIEEEHQLRKCALPPISPAHHRRGLESVRLADYVIAVSNYVRDSFIDRGFPAHRILVLPRPVNIQYFHPASEPRPKSRPPTFISTGSLNFRKGAVYLLEAFDLIQKQLPDARFLLVSPAAEPLQPWLERFSHLHIDWAPHLPHGQLSARLRSADVFMLLSLEEGMARTGVEALACGLPVVITPNTGVNDLVDPGVNGVVVPLKDPFAAANAAIGMFERVAAGQRFAVEDLQQRLSAERFEENLLCFLKEKQIIRSIQPQTT